MSTSDEKEEPILKLNVLTLIMKPTSLGNRESRLVEEPKSAG